MFEGFANVWTPVVPSRDLASRPVPVTLASEQLVLFRGANGAVGALLDQCPHRGVALSLGEIDGNGCLACPFHGWSFRTDGSCANVPLNGVPEAKLARHAAVALPAREAGGLIWVFTGLDAAGSEPDPPSALTDPDWHRYIHYEDWDTHWTRAMENMLDSPHVPFVHRKSIGRAMRKSMRADSMLRMSVEPKPWGALFPAEMDGKQTGADLMWRRPNGMVLDIKIPGRGLRMHVFCVPLDARRTRMILVATRTFVRWGPLSWLADRFNLRVLLEDRAVVESSRPHEVPPAGDELSVATDGPTLYFRRYYYRELKPSSTTLVTASRLAMRREPGEVVA